MECFFLINKNKRGNQTRILPHCKNRKITRGVSQCGLANYIKTHLKAKEELPKLKYLTMQKYNPLKETKILQDIVTL
jgi:hypothetical protein